MIQPENLNQHPSLFQLDLSKDVTPTIKVIGVGGGGSNAVNHMYRMGIKGVDFLVCNTDAQALQVSPVPTKIQLGPGLTQGRGAGAIPEVGKNAAIENVDELRNLLSDNTSMVFVTAGMGGGTGTGAAPIIAGIARELGILTVGIVTVPFAFEGRKRKQQAELGIEQLKGNVDALLIICNDKLREIYGNLNLSKAFGHADDVLSVAAKSIAEVITNTMHINVDFADIQTVMKDSGVAIMGSASAEGDNRAVRAAELALDSPLLNDNHIEGARYILLNITSGNTEVTMDEVGEINDFIQAQAGQSAEIIMGIGNDATLGDKVGVTIIATGFKTNQQVASEQRKPEKVVFKLEDDKNAAVATSLTEVTTPRVEEKIAIEPEVVDAMEPVLIVRDEVTPSVDEVVSFSPESSEKVIFNLDSDFPTIEINNDSTEEMNFEVENEPVVASNDNDVFNFRMEAEAIALKDEEESRIIENETKEEVLTPEQEMFRRSRERIMRLKELSYKMNSPNGISDLEKEPAYKRRNVRLENVPNSADSSVSRLTLSVDDADRKPEIRANNSFLHDRVD
ncbi:MAG TPA: cell division protein FtsZ [Bacteroidia bacterium]|nr:cell division protein FtsZ [Bacteroidia bacterium]HQF27368.1 cell division protein FtsZ [Bacteroidia bacterium]HQK96853.1 cell division protein FtsZ [Bacteroidia bacterium]